MTKNLFASSENRDTSLYPNGNSYTLHLTTPIKHVKRVELLHASIPNTLFNLTDGTGVIGLSNAITPHTTQPLLTYFSIPKGFYSAPAIANEISNAVSNNTNISMAYIVAEGKFMFSRDDDTPFTLWSNTAELSHLLGFNSSNTQTLINSSNVAVSTGLDIPLYSDNLQYVGKDFIKSDHVANLAPNEGVFLDILEFRSNSNEDAVALDGGQLGTYSGQNISRSFGLIPMDVSSGAIKRFDKNSDYDFAIDYPHPIDSLSRLTVRWVDKNGQLLDFNGQNDNSFLLRFYTV